MPARNVADRCIDARGLALPCHPSNATGCSEHLSGAFELRDVCVRYNDRTSSRPSLVSLDPRWPAGCVTPIYGFSEYTRRYRILTNVKPAAFHNKSLEGCRWRRLGLGVRFSSTNLYHQMCFAAATHAALAPHVAPDALFVPFGSNFPHTRPSRVWELTLRALSTASAVLGDHLEVNPIVHSTQRTRMAHDNQWPSLTQDDPCLPRCLTHHALALSGSSLRRAASRSSTSAAATAPPPSDTHRRSTRARLWLPP